MASSSGAGRVAGGILSSRITGFVRERVIGFFFGVGAHADVFRAAIRIPNILQNLLGEGTISAAFIPIYSRFLDEERHEDAGRFAGAILGLLIAVAFSLAALGMLFAGPIVSLIVPDWVNDEALVASGELPFDRFALTVEAIRYIFPMTAVLVLAAWALGILNSHRKFFIPYVAPVLWNVAIIGGFFVGAAYIGGESLLEIVPGELAMDTLSSTVLAGCIGALVGGVFQFGVQLPGVIRSMRSFDFSLDLDAPGVRQSIRAFGPVVAGRGIYQLSAYLDTALASFLATGAISSLVYAQTFYMLPISLFGGAVAAAELPELSRVGESNLDRFLNRTRDSARQMFFLIAPTVIGYLAFGFLLVGALYQTGQFNEQDTWLVYFVLGAYAIGIIATSLSRLLQNVFYALDDTKTPAMIAAVRVATSAAVAVPVMFWLDTYSVEEVTGISFPDSTLYLGAVGLALGSAIGAWVEVLTLRVRLRKRLGVLDLPFRRLALFVGLSIAALLPAGAVWWLLPGWGPILLTLAVVGSFALAYLGVSALAGFPEIGRWLNALKR